MRHARPSLAAAALLLAAVLAGSAEADTLASLERERAHLVAVLTDPGLEPGLRQQKIDTIAGRLRDLERLVLRDDGLLGRATPEVRQAFARYELTFLLHAAAERGVSLAELWFGEVGLSSESLGTTRVGWR